ncbi:twin-arginine translocation signal domain-containing protein, partial [Streptomyces kunmingensis]
MTVTRRGVLQTGTVAAAAVLGGAPGLANAAP